MELPKSLKVGGTTYEIRIANEWPGHDFADGEVFYDKINGNIIYIREDLSLEAQEITLIHEILHACNSTINHEFLDSLAEQIYQVLKDNKLNFT